MAIKFSKKADDFLERRLTAKLASIKEDGSPHVTPMWYAREGDNFVLNSTAERVKTRNIERDPRVELLIDDWEDYVLIEGEASVSRDRDGLKDAEVLAVRYVGEKGAAESMKTFRTQNRVTIVIKPLKVIERLPGQ